MKILAVADLHGAQYRLNLILKNIEKYSPALLVICGDLTHFGPGDLAKNFLDQIPIETLAITGNIDSSDVGKKINESKATNIEIKKIVKNGISFVGISGVNPKEIKILQEKNLLDSKSILVTHLPPKGLQDKIFIGLHGGSDEIRQLVDKYKPRLVLSGHIHEDPGFIRTKKTIVVNCSMGKRGEGALIEINGEIKVKMLD
jgi:uncharacterized protein